MAVTLSIEDRGQEVGEIVRKPAQRGTEIELHGLYKYFGPRDVLHDIDLTVSAGEFVAIIGRSGCGKSTLLRLLAGLDTPSAGRILLDKRPVGGASLPDVRLMFQDARLLPWKHVAENVGIGLPNDRDTKDLVQTTLAQVELADRADDWPRLLSGGQRQRVALARALAASPRLLLLDEPLGALDALTRRGMQDLIARLWGERRFTAVLVTHDPEEAVALADRVVVLQQGKVTLDLRIDLPRPRPRNSSAFADLAETLLNAVLGSKQETKASRFEVSRAD